MRIGVLTLPLHINYGGILQAYALQQVLKGLGHEVVMLDKERYVIRPWYLQPFVYGKRAAWKYILKKQTTVFIEQKKRKEREIIQQYTDDFIKKNIDTIRFDYYNDLKEKDFDCVIIGSDQVWRPKYAQSLIGGLYHSYLDFAKNWNILKIAYAASFGVDNWEYTEKQTKVCRTLVKKFDAVSVRESSGVDLCKKHFGIKAKHVLDPTMLLDKDDYIALFRKSKTPKSPGNLLVYILDETDAIDDYIKRFAQKNNLTPFRVNRRMENNLVEITQRVQPPVESWLRGFYDAEYVITDSFHACVFSIIFNKPFVVLGNLKRGMSRFESLLNMFGLEKQLCFDLDKFELNNKINYGKVNLRLGELKSYSFEYLKECLK